VTGRKFLANRVQPGFPGASRPPACRRRLRLTASPIECTKAGWSAVARKPAVSRCWSGRAGRPQGPHFAFCMAWAWRTFAMRAPRLPMLAMVAGVCGPWACRPRHRRHAHDQQAERLGCRLASTDLIPQTRTPAPGSSGRSPPARGGPPDLSQGSAVEDPRQGARAGLTPFCCGASIIAWAYERHRRAGSAARASPTLDPTPESVADTSAAWLVEAHHWSNRNGLELVRMVANRSDADCLQPGGAERRAANSSAVSRSSACRRAPIRSFTATPAHRHGQPPECGGWSRALLAGGAERGSTSLNTCERFRRIPPGWVAASMRRELASPASSASGRADGCRAGGGAGLKRHRCCCREGP